MNTNDLERFKRIPRNDILIYLYQNSFLGNDIKIRDIYERINKPTSVFCLIIDDLIQLNLIECNHYISLTNNHNSLFPDTLRNVEIKLTPDGEDYVESKILGFNLQKYSCRNSLETIRIGGFSGTISDLYKKSFAEFSIPHRRVHFDIDIKDVYYILTGINHKEHNEKKVFISYSWDNEDHKKWVKALALELKKDFMVEFDDNLKPGMTPSHYMKHNILSSD